MLLDDSAGRYMILLIMNQDTDNILSSGDEQSRWSVLDAALYIVKKLQDCGYVAYFAGGCVRDELLGIKPDDIDVATEARPEIVCKLFRNTRAVGEAFGVVLVQLYGHSIEVATFRTEWGYSDKRRPDGVDFSDAEHDAARRDFTINGLFKNPLTDEIIDFVGGQADLQAGIIRAIGNPHNRLAEDHLRALRAVRFAARFNFNIEHETFKAIKQHAQELQGISRERIGIELNLMMSHVSRVTAAELLQELQLDEPVLGEENISTDLDTLTSLAGNKVFYPTALAAWALDRLSNSTGGFSSITIKMVVDTVKLWRKMLILSNDDRDALQEILIDVVTFNQNWNSMTIAQRKRILAHTYFLEVSKLLNRLNNELLVDILEIRDKLSNHAGGIAPVPYITGKDLLVLGLKSGPDFREILDQIYDAQLEGSIISREQAYKFANLLVQGKFE